MSASKKRLTVFGETFYVRMGDEATRKATDIDGEGGSRALVITNSNDGSDGFYWESWEEVLVEYIFHRWNREAWFDALQFSKIVLVKIASTMPTS